MRKIIARRNQERTFLAALQRIDMNPVSTEDTEPVKLTEEQQTVIERQKAASLARIRNRQGNV